MIIARPDAAEERWLVLGGRYPALRAAVAAAGRTGAWKTSTWRSRCVGFVLAVIGAVLLGGAMQPFGSPLLPAGALLLGGAEWLIAQRRIVRSGFEEGSWLCGAVAITVQLMIGSDGHGDAAGAALVATTVVLAGWRLLNPLFTTLGVAGYSVAIALVDTRLFDGRLNAFAAAAGCAAVALVALLAGGRTWRRPAHDRMLDGLVIAMPWLAWAWLFERGLRDAGPTTWLALGTAATFLALTLATGLHRRTRAPLVSALGNLAGAGYCVHVLLGWPAHWTLIAGGGLLLAAALLLDRRLRDRDSGITSKASSDADDGDFAQVAGVAQLAPGAQTGHGASSPAYDGQGGGFGGGGASGRY